MRNISNLFLILALSSNVLFAGDGVWQKSIALNTIAANNSYHIQDKSHISEDERVSQKYEGFIFLN